MVNDVIMGNIVKEKSSHPSKKVTIDGRRSPPREAPFLTAIVRQFGGSMVEVSYHDEPVCNKEPRDAIKLDDRGNRILGAGILDSPSHSDKSQIGENHSVSLSFTEQDGVR